MAQNDKELEDLIVQYLNNSPNRDRLLSRLRMSSYNSYSARSASTDESGQVKIPEVSDKGLRNILDADKAYQNIKKSIEESNEELAKVNERMKNLKDRQDEHNRKVDEYFEIRKKIKETNHEIAKLHAKEADADNEKTNLLSEQARIQKEINDNKASYLYDAGKEVSLQKELFNIIDEIKDVEEKKKQIDEERQKLVDSNTENSKELNRLGQENIRDRTEILQLLSTQVDDEKELLGIREKLDSLSEKELERRRQLAAEEDYINQKRERGVTLSERIEHSLEKHGVNVSKVRNGYSQIERGIGGIKQAVMGLIEPWSKVDQAAFDFTKRIGGSATSARRLRDDIIDLVNNHHIGTRFGASMEDMVKMMSDYDAAIGRHAEMTASESEQMAAMRKVFGEQGAIDYTSKLENFGYNPEEAYETSEKIYKNAAKHGLSVEKYSKNFLDNIRLAQSYNFKDGVDAIERMAERSTAIKLNMQQVESFSNKVSTLEGAMQAGAQLSVLGGQFSQISNPMSLLNAGLNDNEQLMNAIENMLEGQAHWNANKGQLEVSGEFRQKLRAAAQATGMNYDQLIETTFAKERKNIVNRQLRGSSYDDETKELISNKAQLDKNGNAYISVHGEKRMVNELGNEDLQYLKENSKPEAEKLTDIAAILQGWDDSMKGLDIQKDAAKANLVKATGIGDRLKTMIDTISESNHLLEMIYGAQAGFAVLAGIGNLIYGAITMSGFASGGAFGSSKSAASIMKGGMRGGALIGIAGGAYTAYNEFAGKNNHSTGKKIGSTAGATIGGVVGGALGSFLGPIGTMIGGAAGSYAGNWLGGKIGNYLSDSNSYIQEHPQLEGFDPYKYSVSELEQVLDSNGNINALDPSLKEKIDADSHANEAFHKLGTPTYAKGVVPYVNHGGVGIVRGPKHAEGGVPMVINGRMSEVEGGEAVINASKTIEYNNELRMINEGVMPKISSFNGGSVENIVNPGLNMMGETIKAINTSNVGGSQPTATNVTVSPITINGQIDLKIEGMMAGAIDASKLASNPVFMKQLTDIIMKQMNIYKNGSFDKGSNMIKFG